MFARKWGLVAVGSVVLVYSIAVLFFIITTPDVGLRVIADESIERDEPRHFLRVGSTRQMDAFGESQSQADEPIVPTVGDELQSLGGMPLHNYLDFASRLSWLRNAQSVDGPLMPGQELLEAVRTSELSPFVEYADGTRFIRAKFRRASDGNVYLAWLRVQSLPVVDVLLSLVWFSLQLSFLLLCGFLCWNRPYDRAARVMLGLAIVSLGTTIACNDWWVMAASLWMIVPCAICGLFLPAVLLHLFVVFPRPQPVIQLFPRLSLGLIYSIPGICALATLGFVLIASRLHTPGELEHGLAPLFEGLWIAIAVFLVISAGYVVTGLVVLRKSLVHLNDPAERVQIRWLWQLMVTACLFLVIAAASAVFRPTNLVLGRLTFFLSSICFIAAFLPVQFVQLNQLISRNMLYYAASLGLSAAISLIIALSILIPQWFSLTLTTQQSLGVAAVLTLSVVLLLWLRDAFQQLIDRQFFRDRYRLDHALQRIQQSVAELSDPQAIARLFLGSCQDVLRVDRAAFYLRTLSGQPFRLVAAAGTADSPAELALDGTFLDQLTENGSLQRITSESREQLTSEQALLWELDVDLAHGIDSADGISGVVLLGQKRDALTYTAEDLTFLNAIGQITNVAMYSSRVVDQNISRLNEDLSHKLKTIADQQRQIAVLQTQLSKTADGANRNKNGSPAFQRERCKGNSPAMVRIIETARKVAESDSSVLLRGESGTGKEVLAQVLHENSSRSGQPLVRVHCASLSPGLLESELFGHVKGAFTGAHEDRTGRFEAAHGGTLFLDEIGDITLETQIKLLRVLQERSFEPVGSLRTIHVDVRLVTATHQNLEDLIQKGRFREDLFYRLNVISMELPPLRDRREDILELALHFLSQAAARSRKVITGLEPEAIDALECYRWPGNIRELENVVERAVVLAEGPTIQTRDLPPEIRSTGGANALRSPSVVRENPLHHETTQPSPVVLHNDVPDGERQQLQAALESCDGNKSKAARMLGIPRSTLFSKLKRHGLA